MSADLSVRDLTRDHGGGRPAALQGLDLHVPAAGCLALVGGSGSGKTTALRLIAGLDVPDRGDVLVDGESVLTTPPERRGVSMVFQRPLLFPHLDVVDNVAFSARAGGASRRASRADASSFLELVQMGEHASRRPGQLSGGQQQRVALARALAARPRLLLLDEAFTGLDTVLRDDMHELLRRVRAELAPTIVLVTHDHVEAAALADRVAVLDGGRLLQHEDVSRIYTRPASLAVSRMLGGRNEVPGHVRDGVHHSVLGRLLLPPHAARSEGPGVLLVRQEAVDVSEDLTRVRRGAAGAEGIVTGLRTAPGRQLVAVTVSSADGEVVLHAETPVVQRLALGARVALGLPRSAMTVVPRVVAPSTGAV